MCLLPFLMSHLAMLLLSCTLLSNSIYRHVFRHSMAASLTYILKIPAFHSQTEITHYQLMNTPINASNTDTWRPSWERHPELSHLLRPYSTAAVASEGMRPQPELWDICTGCILWLPPKADVGEILDPRLSSRDPGFFDHPILVLNIEITGPRDATVHFVTMTSLRKRSLEDMHPYHRDRYLPVYPANPHPNSGLLLRLENERPGRGMVENSYVSIDDGVFSLEYRALRCYAAGQKGNGYRHRLKRESFDQAMRELGRSSSAWIETGGLWEEFVRNHVPTGAEEVLDLDT